MRTPARFGASIRESASVAGSILSQRYSFGETRPSLLWATAEVRRRALEREPAKRRNQWMRGEWENHRYSLPRSCKCDIEKSRLLREGFTSPSWREEVALAVDEDDRVGFSSLRLMEVHERGSISTSPAVGHQSTASKNDHVSLELRERVMIRQL